MNDQLPSAEKDALEHALAVILARVRCALIHGQTNGGRCVSCISWAKRVGVPEHLPRLLQASVTPPGTGAGGAATRASGAMRRFGEAWAANQKVRNPQPVRHSRT